MTAFFQSPLCLSITAKRNAYLSYSIPTASAKRWFISLAVMIDFIP